MGIAEKIRKIEALLEGAKSEGERQAAERAKVRLSARFVEEPIEYTISCGSIWQKRLLVSVCKKHGYSCYRYYRQKYTTAMIRIGKTYLDEVLYPEYLRHNKMFTELVDEMMVDLINKIHKVDDDDDVVISGALSHA